MNTSFTFSEAVPYFSLLIISGWILISNFRKGYISLWSPMTIVVLVIGYYCLLGPYQTIIIGNTHDRMLNMRPFYAVSFWGALIS
ncbi:hypothetical protein, partial [Chryseosolibacter indicus]